MTHTKGHTASKVDAASQHVEHFSAQRQGKKAIKKHYSARATPDVTQHPVVFPQEGFAGIPGEQGCSWTKRRTSGAMLLPFIFCSYTHRS